MNTLKESISAVLLLLLQHMSVVQDFVLDYILLHISFVLGY